MQFCTIDYIGEVTRCVKNGWNRLAGGGATYKCNITWKTFLTIPYLTFFYSVCLYSPSGLTNLHALKRCGLPQGSAFWGHIDTDLHFGVKTPENPKFWNWMPDFQPNQYTWITFERWEIDEKFQRSPVQNRGRRIERWRHCCRTPLSSQNNFRFIFTAIKIANNVINLMNRRKTSRQQ
jgi:hypothetical protein